MKKVMCVILCFSDCVLGLVQRISLYAGSNPSNVGYSIGYGCSEFSGKFQVGRAVLLGDAIVGIWNGKSFDISQGTDDAEIEITSNDISLTLNSLRAKTCRICAPNLQIYGLTRIDNLKAEVLNNEHDMDILGTLTTKFCEIHGSATINGKIDLLEDGGLIMKGIRNDYLVNRGVLSSRGKLTIDTTGSYLSRMTNDGIVYSDSGEIVLSANTFINGTNGKITGNDVVFQIREVVENYGVLDLIKCSIISCNCANFIQKGACMIRDIAKFSCDIESYGQTEINQLNFLTLSHLVVNEGRSTINYIFGDIPIIEVGAKAVLEIANSDIRIEHIESVGRLAIEELKSDRNTIFSTKAGGKIKVRRANLPDSFMFSRNGQIEFDTLHGRASALITEQASIDLKGASQLTLVSDDEARGKITDSCVEMAYFFGNSKNSLFNSRAMSFVNYGDFDAANVAINKFENQGRATFAGITSTAKMENEGEMTFVDGEHRVGLYNGKNRRSKISAKGSHYYAGVDIHNENVILQDGRALVLIENILGQGIIESQHQIYQDGFLYGYQLQGNADIFLDYMPDSFELPECTGETRLHISLAKDFINDKDRHYEDVILFINMNDHDWKNADSDFIAKALRAENVRMFGNYNGRMVLRDFLQAKAEQIVNTAVPKVRDNGRWVHDSSNWRAHLHFYMPAEYLSQNQTTGIVSGGDILLDTETIHNEFSTIAACCGLQIDAGKEIRNRVGTIAAQSKSRMGAPEIINEDAGVTIRKGEGHASGRCGWGFGRHTWHYDLYVAELVNKSDGARMIFGDKIQIDGQFKNIGSTLTGKHIDMSCPPEQISVLQNASAIGAVKDESIGCICMQLWSIVEKR